MNDVSDAPVDPREVVPGYETDLSAVGANRRAVDPDGDQPWWEAHGLTADEAQQLADEVQL